MICGSFTIERLFSFIFARSWLNGSLCFSLQTCLAEKVFKINFWSSFNYLVFFIDNPLAFFLVKSKFMFCSWEGMGVVKDVILRPYNYAEQNDYLKPLIWCVLGIDGRRSGVVALQSLFINKKGTSPFNFQSNEPFSKFLRQQMNISKFLSDIFRDKTRLGGHTTFDHSQSWEGH